DPERIPGAHSRLLRTAHDQGATNTDANFHLVNTFLLRKVELKSGSNTIDSITLEHEVDETGQPLTSLRVGNLTGVEHDFAQGLPGPWRWDYHYMPPPAVGPVDWLVYNEIDAVDLKINGVVQSHWAYQRTDDAGAYEYIDARETVTDVFAPGHGGKAT